MKIRTTKISQGIKKRRVDENKEKEWSMGISCESEVSIENSFPSASSTRSNSTPRTPCTPAPDKYKTLCVMCGFAYKGTYEKFRISEDSRAKKNFKWVFVSAMMNW